MDINTILQAVTTVGFPIVMCLVMAWYIKTINESHRKEIENINGLHKSETDKFTEAINNNTLALQKICDRIDGDKNV